MNNTTATQYEDYTQSLFTQITLAFGNYWICIVCPLGIAFNAVIVITLFRGGNVVPQTTRVLMLNQSTVEMNACLWLIISQVSKSRITSYTYDDLGHAVCFVLPFTFWVFDAVAGFNNTIITVERYFAVCHPLKRLFTTRRTLILVLLTDVSIASIAVFELWMIIKIDPDGQCVWNTDGPWLKLAAGLYFTEEVAPLVAVVIFYPQMLRTIRMSSKNMTSTGGNVKAAASNRLTVTLFAASVVQVASNTPDTILYSITLSFMGVQLLHPWAVQQVFETVPKTLYPLFNPILYSFSSQKFRNGIVKAFTCKKSRNPNKFD